MRINNNIPALNTHRMMTMNANGLEKTLEKLSSGKRINKAADDAAGLAISQKMEAQIRGLRQASRNALDGISLIQTAEGALNEVHAMLQRMRELSVQGANGVYADEDLEAIANELKELTEQIDKIANDTEFNGIPLLKGDLSRDNTSTPLRLHIGANKDQTIEIDMSEINIRVIKKVEEDEEGQENIGGLELINHIDENAIIKLIDDNGKSKFQVNDEGLDPTNFEATIKIYDDAITKVSSHRSKLGAYQNRLEHTIKNLDNTAENLTSAKSRIEDADMAIEMSEFVKLSILQQAGTAMLSQANQLPQSVLQLLQ